MNVIDDVNERFQRLDGLAVPDLWNEATVRAADPDEVARRSLPDLDSGPMSYAVPIALAAAAVLAVASSASTSCSPEAGRMWAIRSRRLRPISSPIPSPTATPLEPSAIDAGFIGLLQRCAAPRTPKSEEIVTSVRVDGNHPSVGGRACSPMADDLDQSTNR